LRATEAFSVISIHSLDLVNKIRNQNRRSRPEEPVAQGQNFQGGISNLPLTSPQQRQQMCL